MGADFTVMIGTSWRATLIYGNLVAADEDGALPVPQDRRNRYYLPIDITGATAKVQVRSYPEADEIATLTDNDALTITADEGRVDVDWLADTPDPGVYQWAGKLTLLGGDVVALGKGLLTIEPELVE